MHSYVQQLTSFLYECVEKNLIPKFLKFHIPSNGCFNHEMVRNFQGRLLTQELKKTRRKKMDFETKLQRNWSKLQGSVKEFLWPSIRFFVRWHCRLEMSKSKTQLLRKMHNLCFEQDRPELNTNAYLTVLDNISVPQMVEKVLEYGPRHTVQKKLNEQHFLANIDTLLSDCISQNIEAKMINQSNSLKVGSTNKMRETRQNNEIIEVKKRLKDNDI